MQPRPQFPMQGMGQGMMGPRPGANPFAGRGTMMMGQGASPFGGRGPMMGGAGQMGRGGGGMLSRLLGRGNPAGAAGGALRGFPGAAAGRAAGGGGGGLLQSLTNPGGLTGFLNNTQQVLRTAQQFGPMIQQYGPMVKNLPAMWKLYRGLKNASTNTEDNTDSKEKVKKESKSTDVKHQKSTGTKKVTTANAKTAEIPKHTSHARGSSVPKMYI
jgi:hypothetical protein